MFKDINNTNNIQPSRKAKQITSLYVYFESPGPSVHLRNPNVAPRQIKTCVCAQSMLNLGCACEESATCPCNTFNTVALYSRVIQLRGSSIRS